MNSVVKKKVLIVTNNLYGGGAEKVLETMVAHLDKNKYEITIYTLHKTDIKEDTYLNIRIRHFFSSNKIYTKVLNKILIFLYNNKPNIFYKLLIKEKYDVEIAFIEGYATKIVANSSNKNSKKLAWVHVDLINTPWTDIAYNNIQEEINCYKVFDKILCVSEDVKNKFLEKYNIVNVQVQYNPIDENIILKKANMLCEYKRHTYCQFVAVGRLEHQKGYDRLLRVVKKLREENFSFNIQIIGKGNLEESFQSYIIQNNLENYVTLIGYLDNPYPLMKQADALICSSYSEGYSTVVIESIIIGTPVLTTNCCGMKEIYEQCNFGSICDNNIDGLYEMLHNFLTEKNILNKGNLKLDDEKSIFNLNTRIKEIENLL